MRFLTLLVALLLPVTTHATGTPSIDKIMADRVLGKANAPVTIYEYASLTCSHCATFATTVLPELEKQAIETGKAKIIFRDFPLDGTALKASALARCLPAEQYYPFLKLLFKQQTTWMSDKDPTKALLRLSSLAGLAPATAEACMSDTKILDAIASARMAAAEKYKIQSTPTFVFNDGIDIIAGSQSVEIFMQKIEKLQPEKMSKIPAVPTPIAPPIAQ